MLFSAWSKWVCLVWCCRCRSIHSAFNIWASSIALIPSSYTLLASYYKNGIAREFNGILDQYLQQNKWENKRATQYKIRRSRWCKTYNTIYNLAKALISKILSTSTAKDKLRMIDQHLLYLVMFPYLANVPVLFEER